jgi:hypothetical protein
MGWRNMFIDLEKSSMDRIMEFVNHHNNWYDNFSKEDIKKMDEEDTVPGEELQVDVIIQENNGKKHYWAYLGNHGGSSWTEDWAEKYFDDIKIYNSCTFDYYEDNWLDWKLISVDDYKNII